MPTTTAVLTIERLERRTNSRSGNPRWRVTFTDGSEHVTADDSAVGSQIGNSEFQGVPLRVSLTDGAITAAVLAEQTP